MELIQNAEDNEYEEGVKPTLEFVMTKKDITGSGAPATLLVNQAHKIQKENSTSIASNAPGEKYRKQKPTNLKPFRFRTDERGMFKKATLEKKAHAPLKEITLVRTPGAKSTSKHQNVIQAKHWSNWSYLEEQTRMEFLVLHEVDVYEMDIHLVSNGRNLMSPSSAFLMLAITLG